MANSIFANCGKIYHQLLGCHKWHIWGDTTHPNLTTLSICQLWQILYSPTVAKYIISCQVANNGTPRNDITHPNLRTSSICQLWQTLSQVARLPKVATSVIHPRITRYGKTILLLIYWSILHLIMGFSFHFW